MDESPDNARNDDSGGNDARYTLISADCHGGGALTDYRPYLPAKYHREFDEWAGSYVIEFEDLLGDLGTRNWDSKRRLADLEADGVVAEVIYPNTIPPFYPRSTLTFQPPAQTAGEVDKRWAGLQAHNRWLADFCSEVPGRRAGIAEREQDSLHGRLVEIDGASERGDAGRLGGRQRLEDGERVLYGLDRLDSHGDRRQTVSHYE